MKMTFMMIKDYISPAIEVVALDFEGTVLSGSVPSPAMEDFTVSDGEW
ncbi:MAG: hypothetical protein IJN02_01995 [Bacteroidales bacterium]|nr:hypothetical protein [Bacteroidales bacterium]